MLADEKTTSQSLASQQTAADTEYGNEELFARFALPSMPILLIGVPIGLFIHFVGSDPDMWVCKGVGIAAIGLICLGWWLSGMRSLIKSEWINWRSMQGIAIGTGMIVLFTLLTVGAFVGTILGVQ